MSSNHVNVGRQIICTDGSLQLVLGCDVRGFSQVAMWLCELAIFVMELWAFLMHMNWPKLTSTFFPLVKDSARHA